jgi:hypothetical protein
MANSVTVFTKAGDWKADINAWKNNFLAYKSIGTDVTVYHREQTKNIWGNTVTDWVEKPASVIEITNVYHGSGPGAATRQKSCQNASNCELKEWAVGFNITVQTDSGDTSVGGGATLDIDSVNGSAVIVIGDERLTGQVSAGSALSDNSIWG